MIVVIMISKNSVVSSSWFRSFSYNQAVGRKNKKYENEFHFYWNQKRFSCNFILFIICKWLYYLFNDFLLTISYNRTKT